MLIYLDSVIVIYAIEGAPAFKPRAAARLAAAKAAGDTPATSDLTRLECLVQPLRSNNAILQADYSQFLIKTRVLTLPPNVFDEAARIRAHYNFRVPEALHLAAAIAGHCDIFLTNDARLARFPDMQIEILG